MRLTGAVVESEATSPLGLVTVVSNRERPFRYAPGRSVGRGTEPPLQLGLFTDGDAMSAIVAYDGNPETVDECNSGVCEGLARCSCAGGGDPVGTTATILQGCAEYPPGCAGFVAFANALSGLGKNFFTDGTTFTEITDDTIVCRMRIDCP